MSKTINQNQQSSPVIVKPVYNMTEPQFIQFMLKKEVSRGANFVGVHSRTIPSMNKKNNPYFGEIYKESVFNCVIGGDYEKAVNKQREKEGKESNFKKQEAKYGNMIENPYAPKVLDKNGEPTPQLSKVIKSHNETFYFYLRTLSVSSSKLFWNSGVPLTETESVDAKTFYKKRSPSKSQGVSDEIPVRNYKIESIVSLTIDKETIVIKH